MSNWLDLSFNSKDEHKVHFFKALKMYLMTNM